MTSQQAKIGKLHQLREDYQNCDLCPLSLLRQKVVHGNGNINAKLMVIAEAPSKKEDEEGVPLFGPAGEKFNRLLEAVGLSRTDTWITNICLCRPKSDKPGKENRAPHSKEIIACSSRLYREIEIIRPEIIVLSGNTPLLAFTGLKGITSNRGWLDVNLVVNGWRVSKVFATLHPASLLYGSTDQLKQKRQWIYEDWLEIAKVVNGQTQEGRERGEVIEGSKGTS